MGRTAAELIEKLEKKLEADRELIKAKLTKIDSIGDSPDLTLMSVEPFAKLAAELNRNNSLYLEMIKTEHKVGAAKEEDDSFSGKELDSLYDEMS